MVELAQMELMNTIVPVFLDTLEQTVKQVNCCCKLYCNMQVFFFVCDFTFQNLNTETHSKVSECNTLYSEILTRSLCVTFVLDVNDCMPNPCENGGNCTDGVNEYLFVPVFLDTLEQTVKQVNCCKLYCKNISFHMLVTAYFKFWIPKIIINITM